MFLFAAGGYSTTNTQKRTWQTIFSVSRNIQTISEIEIPQHSSFIMQCEKRTCNRTMLAYAFVCDSNLGVYFEFVRLGLSILLYNSVTCALHVWRMPHQKRKKKLKEKMQIKTQIRRKRFFFFFWVDFVNYILKVESCSASLSLSHSFSFPLILFLNMPIASTWFLNWISGDDFTIIRSYFQMICLYTNILFFFQVEFTSPVPSWHVIKHPKKPVRYPRWLLLLKPRLRRKKEIGNSNEFVWNKFRLFCRRPHALGCIHTLSLYAPHQPGSSGNNISILYLSMIYVPKF